MGPFLQDLNLFWQKGLRITAGRVQGSVSGLERVFVGLFRCGLRVNGSDFFLHVFLPRCVSGCSAYGLHSAVGVFHIVCGSCKWMDGYKHVHTRLVHLF